MGSFVRYFCSHGFSRLSVAHLCAGQWANPITEHGCLAAGERCVECDHAEALFLYAHDVEMAQEAAKSRALWDAICRGEDPLNRRKPMPSTTTP